LEQTSIAEIVTSLSGRLDRASDVERLRIALSELPSQQQLLLELHYWHELGTEALAEVFETTSGAIRVRLSRARIALRERMGQIATGESQDSLLAALSQPERKIAEPAT
jgi:RNA polymerase sigma-70 factor (ECF subfamily)